MGRRNTFTVRVSRFLLLFITLVGLLFLAVGLDLAFLHVVFDADVGADKPILFWVFNIVAIGVGGLIVITESLYLLIPPVMMRVTRDEVTFGTGLRYKQTSIPLRYLKSVEVYEQPSQIEIWGKRRTVKGGVKLRFDRSTSIPASLTTSAGISYSDYRLRLKKAYMNRSLRKTVERVEEFMR